MSKRRHFKSAAAQGPHVGSPFRTAHYTVPREFACPGLGNPVTGVIRTPEARLLKVDYSGTTVVVDAGGQRSWASTIWPNSRRSNQVARDSTAGRQFPGLRSKFADWDADKDCVDCADSTDLGAGAGTRDTGWSPEIHLPHVPRVRSSDIRDMSRNVHVGECRP